MEGKDLATYCCVAFCLAIAGYMGINNIEGWGWFLFVAALCL